MELATIPDVKTGELAKLTGSSETRKQMVCKDMLRGDAPTQAKAEASKAYKLMLENPLVIATYGSEALSGLNAIVDRMFKDIKAGKDPEVAKMIKGLTKTLDDISHKYNAADPKFVAKYQEMSNGFLGFFGGAAAFWRMFLRDIKSIQMQIDDAENVIESNLVSAQHVISYYDELYKENDAELSKVIYQIAVMEYIVDIATQDVESIPSADDHDTTEERGQRADLIKNLQNRINAYKSRLFFGETASPQIRSQISLNIGLYGTVSITKDITFPTMKFVMVQMALLRESQDIAEQNNAFRDTLNQALQQYAVNASVIVPQIEAAVSRPVLLARTVEVMRDAFVAQTEGVIKVLADAEEQNAILEDLYQSTITVFNTQTDKVTDSIIDRAVEATRKLETSTKALSA